MGVGGDDGADRTEPVRWLEPEERAAWLRVLALVDRLPAALDAQLQRDAGLTLFEYSVLAVLSERPDRTMPMSELAFLTQGSLSRLSHAASKLERRGLVRRAAHPDDGRYTNAILTDDGFDRVRAAAPAHVAHARELVIDAMSPAQLDHLRHAATAVLERIDPGGPWTRAPS